MPPEILSERGMRALKAVETKATSTDQREHERKTLGITSKRKAGTRRRGCQTNPVDASMKHLTTPSRGRQAGNMPGIRLG